MKVKEEITSIAKKLFLKARDILEQAGSVPWAAFVVSMDASPEGFYNVKLLPLPENKEQAKELITSRAIEINAVAVIMVGEAYITKLSEKGERLDRFEALYTAFRLYDDSLSIKAVRIMRKEGKAQAGDRVNLEFEGGLIVANILPSWNKGQTARLTAEYH